MMAFHWNIAERKNLYGEYKKINPNETECEVEKNLKFPGNDFYL
jgi:hypothetical protein